jgi:DNA-binding beta-propeller fold protein YncE
MRYRSVLTLLVLVCVRLGADSAGVQVSLALRLFPPEAQLSVDGTAVVPVDSGGGARTYVLATGRHSLVAAADGYHPLEIAVELSMDTEIEDKLERRDSGLRKIGEIGTGRGPKSLLFTPDGRYLVTALLFGNGIEVYTVDPLRRAKTVRLDEDSTGFVELAYNHRRKEIWVSQMLADAIHVIDGQSFEPLRVIDSGGVWPKVIAFSPDEETAYASHWKTLDVSFIGVDSGKTFARVPLLGIPRGLAASPDGQYLYIANFTNGSLEVARTDTASIRRRAESGPGAMRHVVLDAAGRTAYGSDMYRGRISRIDLVDLSTTRSARLASNPNTIVLSATDKYLFVSCRGKNNDANWHERGPEYGKIFVLDASTLMVIDWLWGRNQPTGLALSPDGSVLAFTNFYDNTIELYEVALP